MSTTIRQALPQDAEVIVTFNQGLAQETEDKSLPTEVLRKGVDAVLADPAKGTYYLALEDERVIGQLMITYEWSDWRNGWMWWIQSVYVHAQARRRGVFRTLFDHVDRLAKADAEVVGIRLYVELDNGRAQQTYRSLGMEETSYRLWEKSTI